MRTAQVTRAAFAALVDHLLTAGRIAKDVLAAPATRSRWGPRSAVVASHAATLAETPSSRACDIAVATAERTGTVRRPARMGRYIWSPTSLLPAGSRSHASEHRARYCCRSSRQRSLCGRVSLPHRHRPQIGHPHPGILRSRRLYPARARRASHSQRFAPVLTGKIAAMEETRSPVGRPDFKFG